MKKFLEKFWRVVKKHPFLAIGLIPLILGVVFIIFGFFYLFFTDHLFRSIFSIVIIFWAGIYSTFTFIVKFNKEE